MVHSRALVADSMAVLPNSVAHCPLVVKKADLRAAMDHRPWTMDYPPIAIKPTINAYLPKRFAK
jgi:hypothetical protein